MMLTAAHLGRNDLEPTTAYLCTLEIPNGYFHLIFINYSLDEINMVYESHLTHFSLHFWIIELKKHVNQFSFWYCIYTYNNCNQSLFPSQSQSRVTIALQNFITENIFLEA